MADYLDVRVPIDDIYIKILESIRDELKQDGFFRSTNEVIERELLKLHQTVGIRQSLDIDTQFPLIYETPVNSTRLKVRIRNHRLVTEITSISKEINRPVTKIVYSLIRSCIINRAEDIGKQPARKSL